MVEGIDPSPGSIPLWLMVGGTDPTLRKSHMSVDMGGRVDQERCIPIPRQTVIRPEAVGTRRLDILMAGGVQQTGDKLMSACTQYPGNDLNIAAIHPSQRKMTKK